MPLFASSEKKEPATFAEIVKRGSLKHPPNTEEAKGKACLSTIKRSAMPVCEKKRKLNEANTAERTQSTVEYSHVKKCVNEEQQTEGTSAVENPPGEECVDEEQKTEGTFAVETPPVEEFSNKETHTEVTAVVETSPMEEFPGKQKQKEVETLQVEEQHGQEKLEKRFNVENTCPEEKKHENTAFSNAFSQSSSSMSVYLHHIMAICSTCKMKIFVYQ